MLNVECCKVHDSLKFSKRMLLSGRPCGFDFFWGGLPEKRGQFFIRGCDLHRNYGMIVILLPFLCNYDNLTLSYIRKSEATQMKDEFLLADLKLEVYQEWVLLVK